MPTFPSKVSTACTISQLCEEAQARGYVVGTMPFTKQMLVEMLGNGTKCVKAKELAATVRKSNKSRANYAAPVQAIARLDNTTKKKDGSTRPSDHRNGTQKTATHSTTADLSATFTSTWFDASTGTFRSQKDAPKKSAPFQTLTNKQAAKTSEATKKPPRPRHGSVKRQTTNAAAARPTTFGITGPNSYVTPTSTSHHQAFNQANSNSTPAVSSTLLTAKPGAGYSVKRDATGTYRFSIV